MADKLIDIYNRILKYDDNVVYIAFDSKSSEPYFHGKQLCEMLEYENPQVAMQKNVEKRDIRYLKDIVKNYKTLYKNVQGHTKFLSEAGLFTLIMKSKKEVAREIFDWVTREVLPSIRKYGEYKMNSDLKKKIDELNKIILDKNNKIKVMQHNMKKTKYKKENSVYIMRPITDTTELDQDEEIFIKFGKSKDMNTRESTYNTCNPNKIQVLKIIYVEKPKLIEDCVGAKNGKLSHKR